MPGTSKPRCEPESAAIDPSAQTLAGLEAAILQLLHQRGPGKTICPSEAARHFAGTGTRTAWEPFMEPARIAAHRLVTSGRILITQQGHPVDPATAKGPIRFKLC